MGSAFSHHPQISQLFPPTATLTEKNLPSQAGKVFIVTGATSGIGYQLATILYQAGGKVYIGGRNETSVQKAIDKIKALKPDKPSTGELEYLALDLSDLSTIKSAVDVFKSKESSLHVLWNNAGVFPLLGTTSKQGHELQLATNCLGPYLLTQHLLPTLRATAQSALPGSVRVVWAGSQMVDVGVPNKGFTASDLETPSKDQSRQYTLTKLGNWYLGSELAHEVGSQGILSITQNPGNLKTECLRDAPWLRFVAYPFLYEAKQGAYTELWAGLSPELTVESNGAYIVPWGRLHPAPREDLLLGLKGKTEGGTGQAAEFREWCEKQMAEFM